MGVSGNSVAGRSFQIFTVSPELLQKVVEAVQAGDKEARSSGNIQSFEVFCHGFRQNIALGRIYVIPPAVCSDRKTFPTALLHGALIRIFGWGGEEIADLIEKKIGESEFDEYSQADFDSLKKSLFENPVTGKEACLIVFAPNWMNSREWITFHFTQDADQLKNNLRHQVFAAYYDPRVSSAFNALMTNVNTTKVDVTDITPKIPFPFLAENMLKQYPLLQKQASNKTILLNHKTADAVTKETLDPQELDVFDSLNQALEHSLMPKAEGAAGEGGFKTPSNAGDVPRVAAQKTGGTKNCTICQKPITLVPSANERAKKYNGEPSDYTNLFTEHSECALAKRKRDTDELMRKTKGAASFEKSAVSIETRVSDQNKSDLVKIIVDKLNARFAEIKKSNPQGYMDSFEQQLPSFMLDIAQEMSLEVSGEGDNYIFTDAAGKAYKDVPVNYGNDGTLTVGDGGAAPVNQSRIKKHMGSEDEKPLAAHEAPFTNVGPGTSAHDAQKDMVPAMKETVETSKATPEAGNPIGIAIDETGVARRKEEEKKASMSWGRTDNAPTNQHDPSHPETMRVGEERLSSAYSNAYNGGFVDKRNMPPKEVVSYLKNNMGSNDAYAPHAVADHTKQVEAGAYGETPFDRRAQEKWGSAKSAARTYPQYEVNGRIMRDYADAQQYWEVHGGTMMETLDNMTPGYVLQEKPLTSKSAADPNRHNQPIKVGDNVRYAVHFLRSISQYTGPMANATGTVVGLKPFGTTGGTEDRNLVVIDWHGEDLPTKVLDSNLTVVGSPKERFESMGSFEGDAAEIVASEIAASVDEPSEAMSSKAKQARTKKESLLSKFRPKTAVELDIDSIWDAITEDMGPAPLVDVDSSSPSQNDEGHSDETSEGNESFSGGRPNKRDVSDLPEAFRSDKPEEEKAISDHESESEETELENSATKEEESDEHHEASWRVDSKFADFVEEVAADYDEDEDEFEHSSRGCDQCQMMRINGTPCHERGCPNMNSRWDAEQAAWVKQRKCFTCGFTVDADDPCCDAPFEDEPTEDFEEHDAAEEKEEDPIGGAINTAVDTAMTVLPLIAKSKKADTADNPFNMENDGAGAPDNKKVFDVKDTSGPDKKNTASAKKANPVQPDVSEAKSKVVSPDTVDKDIQQPTVSVEEAGKIAAENEKTTGKVLPMPNKVRDDGMAGRGNTPEVFLDPEEKGLGNQNVTPRPPKKSADISGDMSEAKSELDYSKSEVADDPKATDTVNPEHFAASEKTAMMFMNDGEIEMAVDRFQNHPVLGKASRFLQEFMNEVNSHSDGWAYWKPPVQAAKALMTLIQNGLAAERGGYSREPQPEITEKDFLRALAPIKSFYTRRGTAAGMQFPKIGAAGDERSEEAQIDFGAGDLADIIMTEEEPEMVSKTAAVSDSLKTKLHPRRFKGISGKMSAIVGYILGEAYTDPSITEMAVTSDGFVLAQTSNDVGMNDMVGSELDLQNNWKRLCETAGLDNKEMIEANHLFKSKITNYSTGGSPTELEESMNGQDVPVIGEEN